MKGIDAQIMVQRPADYVKDTSALNRQAELARDASLLVGNKETEQQRQTVIQTDVKSDVKLNPDSDGPAAHYEGGGKKGKKKKKDEPEGEGYYPENKIDIRI